MPLNALGTSPKPQGRGGRFDASHRALYDLLMLRRRTDGKPSELAEARAAVDRLKGTTNIIGLRAAALLEARQALAIAELLPPAELIAEDDLEDTAA